MIEIAREQDEYVKPNEKDKEKVSTEKEISKTTIASPTQFQHQIARGQNEHIKLTENDKENIPTEKDIPKTTIAPPTQFQHQIARGQDEHIKLTENDKEKIPTEKEIIKTTKPSPTKFPHQKSKAKRKTLLAVLAVIIAIILIIIYSIVTDKEVITDFKNSPLEKPVTIQKEPPVTTDSTQKEATVLSKSLKDSRATETPEVDKNHQSSTKTDTPALNSKPDIADQTIYDPKPLKHPSIPADSRGFSLLKSKNEQQSSVEDNISDKNEILPPLEYLNSASKDYTYEVKEGDTLWEITKRFTGNPVNYMQTAKDNAIKNPDLIYPGQKINVIKQSDDE